MNNLLAILIIVVGVAVVIAIGPLLTIASLNTLFGLNIAFTGWTWLSMAWLNITTFGGLGMTIRSLKK